MIDPIIDGHRSAVFFRLRGNERFIVVGKHAAEMIHGNAARDTEVTDGRRHGIRRDIVQILRRRDFQIAAGRRAVCRAEIRIRLRVHDRDINRRADARAARTRSAVHAAHHSFNLVRRIHRDAARRIFFRFLADASRHQLDIAVRERFRDDLHHVHIHGARYAEFRTARALHGNIQNIFFTVGFDGNTAFIHRNIGTVADVRFRIFRHFRHAERNARADTAADRKAAVSAVQNRRIRRGENRIIFRLDGNIRPRIRFRFRIENIRARRTRDTE